MIPPIVVTERVAATDPPIGPDDILERCEAELQRFGAIVDRITDHRLVFVMPFDRPKGLTFWEADLGLVSRGTVDVEPEPTGYRVRLAARARGWFLALALISVGLLIWGLGWAPAPWRYALAFGGVPLAGCAWVVAWLNLSAFLSEALKRPQPT